MATAMQQRNRESLERVLDRQGSIPVRLAVVHSSAAKARGRQAEADIAEGRTARLPQAITLKNMKKTLASLRDASSEEPASAQAELETALP